jgi:hypothetical protein
MKISYTGERGLKIEVVNPDEKLIGDFRGRVQEMWLKEAREFMEEVAVGLRKLPNNKKVTLRSKPITVEIERTDG